MTTQIQLKNIVNQLNNYVLEKISNEVLLISINNKKYILKNIIIPLKSKELSCQHKFISYLNKNKINVANICLSDSINVDGTKKIYELQEYIENNCKLNYDEVVIALAKFHYVSKLYKNKYKKRKKYKYDFFCRGILLKYVLLDFKNKYYKYPMKNYKKYRKKLESNLPKNSLNDIIYLYNKVYKDFIKKYDLKSCVIHNDITSNNVIANNKKIYFIDFDLSIIGTEYVDFVDSIIKRYNSLEYISKNFNKIKFDIIDKIRLYNKYNILSDLEYDGVMKMLLLKIASVNLYLMFNEENLDYFNSNLYFLKSIFSNIEGEVYGK